MDPISAIGLAAQLYVRSLRAWAFLQTAIEFPETSRDLLVGLEIERFRFQLWGRNSGLSQGTLHPGLALVEPLIIDRLRRVQSLLQDGGRLKDTFGLSTLTLDGAEGEEQEQEREKEKEKSTKTGLALSLGGSSMLLQSQRLQHELDYQLSLELPPQKENAKGGSLYRRLRWSLSSKSKFEKLLEGLKDHLDTLNKLLTETQQSRVNQEWNQTALEAIGRINDQKLLEAIREAAVRGIATRNIASLASRKAVNLPTTVGVVQGVLMSEFEFDPVLKRKNRFIARWKKSTENVYVLFEKRSYTFDLSPDKRLMLRRRIERLVLLLQTPATSSSRILRCIGYCADPASQCWWLVYQYLQNPQPTLGAPTRPTTLFDLLGTSSNRRPPLEQRFELAYKLSNTFSQLYGSGWLHKGVRSDSIVFPNIPTITDKEPIAGESESFNIAEAFVVGFEYSREYSETETIVKSPQDIPQAIYRHPSYQGLAAEGYKMQYDIYSFGLMLAEIAWWDPLRTFLDVEDTSDDGGPCAGLSSHMSSFGHAEAMELYRRVQWRLKHDMAFKVGSDYGGAVQWCLAFAEGLGSYGEVWEVALDFYNNVVVPLENITRNTSH